LLPASVRTGAERRHRRCKRGGAFQDNSDAVLPKTRTADNATPGGSAVVAADLTVIFRRTRGPGRIFQGLSMHRFTLAAASLVVTTSAFAADALPPLAGEAAGAPHVSGYGEAYLGGVRFVGDDYTTRVGGGAARVNIAFAQRWNLQGDLSYDRIWGHYDPLDATRGAIHGFYRDPDRFAAGIFGAYTTFGFGDGVNVHNHAVGPEAQLYLGNLTLYGQASVGQLAVNDFRGDQWGVRAVARYFVHKNLRLDAEFAFNRTDYNDAYEDLFGAAVQAMYRFDETPWAVFGRYEFERRKFETSTEDTRANKFVIGLRASFGSSTLFDEDRNGATMDTYRPASVISTK
jgi:hypothetical protein